MKVKLWCVLYSVDSEFKFKCLNVGSACTKTNTSNCNLCIEKSKCWVVELIYFDFPISGNKSKVGGQFHLLTRNVLKGRRKVGDGVFLSLIPSTYPSTPMQASPWKSVRTNFETLRVDWLNSTSRFDLREQSDENLNN